MRDVRKYLTTGGALAVLAVSTAIAQQAPTTTPQTQQPNGAVTPQPPRDAAPTPEPAPRDEGVTPETARDTTPVTPETARDTTPVSPESARDITDRGPESARDITDRGPETATDITDRGPETARDISDRGPESARDISDRGGESARDSADRVSDRGQETASNATLSPQFAGDVRADGTASNGVATIRLAQASEETRVATAESAPARDVVTSETDRDRGVAAPVTDREDPNAPGNSAAPAAGAVRSMAQMQQDSRSGCWVKLFDAPNFAGADVTLVGAASMRALDGTFRSIEVGPAATVTTYRTENFGGSIVRFDPGRKVAQNNDEFASLRITCPNVSSRVTPSRG